MFGDEPAAGSIAFARPKSSTLTVPSAGTLMFAGFRSRSRWLVAASFDGQIGREPRRW
jgi:hypothetical protein